MPNTPEYNREYARKRRAKETPEQAAARKLANAERERKRRAALSDGKGPGRKPLIDGEPMIRKTVRLPQRYWDVLDQLGQDNYSAGVRSLIEKHKRWKKTT